jgi:hypoxanthine phosphoribosyltransferase
MGWYAGCSVPKCRIDIEINKLPILQEESLKQNNPASLQVLYTRREIEMTVNRLAEEITREYQGRKPLLVSVLKGSVIFLSDLARRLDFPLELEFVQLSSYGSGTESSGKIRMAQVLHTPLKDRDVLIVEDIVDSGQSMAYLLERLHKKKPASIKLCCLLDKPSRRKVPVTVDYRGFTVPDKFIVGYGMDYAEQYRNLPDIYVIES